MSSQPQAVESVDFVVVGSGVGGLTAAVTAAREADADLDILVLEKATVHGGSSGLSGAQLWIPANHHAEAADIDDSIAAGVDYLTNLAGDLYANAEAARHYVESAREAAEYLEATTPLDLQLIGGMPDYHAGDESIPEGRYLEPQPLNDNEIPNWVSLPHSPQVPGGATNDELLTWGGALTPKVWNWDVIHRRREQGVATMGTALIGALLAAADDLGVRVRTDCGATGLVVEDDCVDGVDTEAGTVRANRGVLLNTGAYDWNPEFLENFEGAPSEEIVSAAIPTAEGDGLKMAASEGAKLAHYPPIGGAKGFFVAVPESEFLDAPLYRYCYNVGLPHAIAVNSNGERFCDESFYPRQAAHFYDPTGEYEDFPLYMVFDEAYRERYALANYKPGTQYPDDFLAAKAETLAGLADQLDLSPEALQATVERFNNHARDGEDPDFSRGDNEWAQVWCGDPTHDPNPNLGPVDSPPYFAVRLYVGLSSMGNTGLVNDDHGRVIDWDGAPIAGLYATGSVLAPVEWGVGYQSGLQNGRSMTYGYLTGRHIAEKDG